MPANRGDKFNDRAAAAAAAKKALIENFRAKPPADDPAVQARAAERRAIAEARDVRTAERRVAKEAEAAGDKKVAQMFRQIAVDEGTHYAAYKAALAKLPRR